MIVPSSRTRKKLKKNKAARKEGGSSEIIFMVEEAPEGGFIARALGASIFTEADSIEELHTNVLDAVRCHFEKNTAPRFARLHFVREEILAV